VAVVVKKVRKLGAGGGQPPGDRAASALRPYFAEKTPACSRACPNHQDVRAALMTLALAESHGKTAERALEEAFYLLADRNPLPASCGRTCLHQCEKQCTRAQVDEPVAIHCVERAVGDFALERRLPLRPLTKERHPERIAIIGSGPASLSCAYQLARRGYPVSVFEAFPQPGGMLRYGIPAYRLPREVLEAEIARLPTLGVEFRCNTAVGRDVAYEDLRRDYAAIFVGIRAQPAVRLGLPGEEAPNVLSAAGFLHRVNTGEPPDLEETVVVIGGGDTAVDAARVATRLGARATILCRRTALEMPAIREEVEEAHREGVRIEGPAAPSAVVVENRRATGLTCKRLPLAGAEASDSEFFLGASTIIVAAKPERDSTGLEALCREGGAITVDEHDETAVPGTFAVPDDLDLGIVSTAIYRGRQVAETIHSRFRGVPVEAATPPPVITHDKMRLDYYYYPKRPRVSVATVPVAERLQAPEREVSLGLTPEEAIAEAKRCMSCGLCFQCDNCWQYCQEQAIVRPAEKGGAYRIKLEFCTGCKKCAEECPCGYIEMR